MYNRQFVTHGVDCWDYSDKHNSLLMVGSSISIKLIVERCY